MKRSSALFAILLILVISSSAFGYTLSGDISGAEWFGGITYVYALSLDVLNPQFYVGLALLGNGTYFIFGVEEGNYILFAFQDRDGDLIPSIDDYLGYYGDVFPEMVAVSGNTSDLDIAVEPLPFTTITGLLSCPEGYFGPTYILAASDPDFEDIVTFGIPLTLNGNTDYTLFVDPGQYYVLAYLDADFSFSRNASDPQIFYGAPGSPALVNVSSGSAANINLPMMAPPDITVTLTPPGTPIVIPGSGGTFDYTIALANAGSETAMADIWIDVTLPDGSSAGPLAGPVELNMPPGYAGERDRSQNVPGSAPAGQFTYHAYAGMYPAIVWDESSFDFEKSASDGSSGSYDWSAGGDDLGAGCEAESPERAARSSQTMPCDAFPNPFNPVTAIRYQLSAADYVHLSVYDVSGREVAALVNGRQDKGYHEVTFDGTGLASGVYIYRLRVNDAVTIGKMLLMK